jgi:hypothetical protein
VLFIVGISALWVDIEAKQLCGEIWGALLGANSVREGRCGYDTWLVAKQVTKSHGGSVQSGQSGQTLRPMKRVEEEGLWHSIGNVAAQSSFLFGLRGLTSYVDINICWTCCVYVTSLLVCLQVVLDLM